VLCGKPGDGSFWCSRVTAVAVAAAWCYSQWARLLACLPEEVAAANATRARLLVLCGSCLLASCSIAVLSCRRCSGLAVLLPDHQQERTPQHSTQNTVGGCSKQAVILMCHHA